MELKEKLISSFMAFEEQIDTDTDLHDVRTAALKNFEEKGFPTKKLEAWKYTSLNAILKKDFTVFPKTESALEFADVKKYFLHEIDTYKVVFIDGIFSSFLSSTTHDGLDVCLMSSALTKPKYKMVIDEYFNKIASQDESLTSLNTAFAREGAFINIPRSKVVDKPIEIMYFSTGSEAALMVQPRNLVIAGENSHVQIVERHQSLSENAVLTNTVTEIFAKKRAIVDYYKLQNDSNSASLVDNTYISQKEMSTVKVHTFSFGGNITRNNLNFFHEGEHIDSTLKGITILDGTQHVDHHTLVRHATPNCESHQNYKGIFSDKSTGVFNGKIYVEKEAQKNRRFPAEQQRFAVGQSLDKRQAATRDLRRRREVLTRLHDWAIGRKGDVLHAVARHSEERGQSAVDVCVLERSHRKHQDPRAQKPHQQIDRDEIGREYGV